MSEAQFVKLSLPIIKKQFNTNYLVRELGLRDHEGSFRPDVALVSDYKWGRKDVDRRYYAHKPVYYQLPIGHDLKFSKLREVGLGHHDLKALVESKLLERVRRGYYIRHQQTPVLDYGQEVVMFEHKMNVEDLGRAVAQATRYRVYANQAYIVMPVDQGDNFIAINKAQCLEFVSVSGSVGIWKLKGVGMPCEAHQAYALGRIRDRYAERFLERLYNDSYRKHQKP